MIRRCKRSVCPMSTILSLCCTAGNRLKFNTELDQSNTHFGAKYFVGRSISVVCGTNSKIHNRPSLLQLSIIRMQLRGWVGETRWEEEAVALSTHTQTMRKKRRAPFLSRLDENGRRGRWQISCGAAEQGRGGCGGDVNKAHVRRRVVVAHLRRRGRQLAFPLPYRTFVVLFGSCQKNGRAEWEK